MSIHYTKEFREEAVRLVLESRKAVAKTADDLGINAWTLRGWVQEHREKVRASDPHKSESLEEENRQLKRELAILKQERDLLKKAAAYFAKEHL